MDIVPIAQESFGVRSMATYVETEDVKVFIDPGVALGPRRYGLPPHPIELQREGECWERIKEYARRSDILVVTHYHYDHYNPGEPEVYRGKMAYIKHPTKMINRSQKWRSAQFLSDLKGLPKEIEFADGKEIALGGTKIKFSSPVFHGTNPRLGYVVEVSIRCGDECFLFTSDVEGPTISDQADFIIEESPNTVLVDGPMTYMLGYRYSLKSLELANENLVDIIERTDVSTLIMEHHFMRDLNYRLRVVPVLEAAQKRGVEVMSAAEYVGRPIDMLEARRKELFEKFPSSTQ